jgi:hypothetical protein
VTPGGIQNCTRQNLNPGEKPPGLIFVAFSSFPDVKEITGPPQDYPNGGLPEGGQSTNATQNPTSGDSKNQIPRTDRDVLYWEFFENDSKGPQDFLACLKKASPKGFTWKSGGMSHEMVKCEE